MTVGCGTTTTVLRKPEAPRPTRSHYTAHRPACHRLAAGILFFKEEAIVKACAYIRVSTKQQSEEGYSIPEQEAAIRSYCETKGYELIEIYVDAGISGRKVHRPEFQRMLAAIKVNQYDVLVVWRLDRATRKPSLGYRLKDALDATNTEIESITEPYIGNRFMYAIALAMAEQQSETRSERAKLGAAGRAKQGMVSGHVRYGYSIGEDGKPEVNEKESKLVHRIFS